MAAEVEEFQSMQDLLSTLDSEIAALESSETDGNVSTLQAMLDGLGSGDNLLNTSESTYVGYQSAMNAEDYQSSVADLLAAADAHEQRLANSNGSNGAAPPPLQRGPTLSALEEPPALSNVDLTALLAAENTLQNSGGNTPQPSVTAPPPLSTLEQPPTLGADAAADLRSNEMLASLLKDLERQGSQNSEYNNSANAAPPIISEEPPPMLTEEPPPMLTEEPPPMLTEEPPALGQLDTTMQQLEEPPPLGSLETYMADDHTAPPLNTAPPPPLEEPPAYDAPVPQPPAEVDTPPAHAAPVPPPGVEPTQEEKPAAAAAAVVTATKTPSASVAAAGGDGKKEDAADDGPDDGQPIELDETWVLPVCGIANPSPWMTKHLQKLAKTHLRQRNELVGAVQKTRENNEKVNQSDLAAIEKQRLKDNENQDKILATRRKTLTSTQLAAQKVLLKELASAFKEKHKIMSGENKAWFKDNTTVLKEELKRVTREYKKDKVTRKSKCTQLTEAAKLRRRQYQEVRDLDARKWAGLEKESRQYDQQNSQIADEVDQENELLASCQSLVKSHMSRLHTTNYSYMMQTHECLKNAQEGSLPLQEAQLQEQQQLDMDLVSRQHEQERNQLAATIQKEHAAALKAFEKRMKGRTKNFTKEMKSEKKTRKSTMNKSDIREFISQQESSFKMSVEEEMANFQAAQKEEEEARKNEQKRKHDEEIALLKETHASAGAIQEERHKSLRENLARKIRVETRRLKLAQHEARLSMLEMHRDDSEKLCLALHEKRKGLLERQMKLALELRNEHKKAYMTLFARHNEEINNSVHVQITDDEDQRVTTAESHYDSLISDLEADYQRRLQELEADHATDFSNLQAKLKEVVDEEKKIGSEI